MKAASESTSKASSGLPAVSIIINNHNYGQFLGSAIESALNQTYANCEVIVVDDGSTDNSRQVIESFGSRVHSIVKTNGGQASALNVGFERSKGTLVLFLDSDDQLDAGAVECVVGAFEPGVGKIQFSLGFMSEDGGFLPQAYPDPAGPLPNGDFSRSILERGVQNTPPTSGNAFSRSVLEQIMPIPEADWKIGADAYLLVVSPLFGRIVSIPRVLGRYRMRGRLPRHALAEGAPGVPHAAWGADAVLRVLEYEERKLAALRSVASRRGETVSDDWPLGNRSYVDCRIYMLLHHAGQHPFKGDSRIGLAYHGVSAACRLRRPGLPWLARVLGYYAVLGMAPAPWARLLTQWRILPWTRPGSAREAIRDLVRSSLRSAVPPASPPVEDLRGQHREVAADQDVESPSCSDGRTPKD